MLVDPSTPILQFSVASRTPSKNWQMQRMRRSQILAAIRGLLVEFQYEDLTVRRIAEASGYSVQTLYNLVGSRDEAISSAISQYLWFVGQPAVERAEDPFAVINFVDAIVDSISANPEFCKHTCQIYFSKYRSVFYSLRDKQIHDIVNLLTEQKRRGVIKSDSKIRLIAEQMIFIASGHVLEWTERPFSLDILRDKLCYGFENLLVDNLVVMHPSPVRGDGERSRCATY